MCQFCLALKRAEARTDQVERNANILAMLIGSHTNKEREREQVAQIAMSMDVNIDNAIELFQAGRMAGESMSAHLLMPLMQENTGMLRKMHVKLAEMVKLYASTPTVLEHVAPLYEISKTFATYEVESAVGNTISKSEDLGVRARLLTGADKIEDMIDVEFAMIGERIRKDADMRYALSCAMLKAMGKECNVVAVGRMIVEASICAFKQLSDSGDAYIEDGKVEFLHLASAMAGH